MDQPPEACRLIEWQDLEEALQFPLQPPHHVMGNILFSPALPLLPSSPFHVCSALTLEKSSFGPSCPSTPSTKRPISTLQEREGLCEEFVRTRQGVGGRQAQVVLGLEFPPHCCPHPLTLAIPASHDSHLPMTPSVYDPRLKSPGQSAEGK